ncbi:hypothetical protein L0P88_13170 [Muricauda sp. SCSIO 64092]|uniref:hypothetical protein n=1 Tax=Allomuricauda sp. SCSIO 64092 TaxID=2908842 RepID=UPI001FF5DA88|nr:hypothetical protein [Muricauda sp. SCSIO 64092]UOY04902.1 hypothetical protein L0P88_13170 [Muricauda sp. SCSIO 64092]
MKKLSLKKLDLNANDLLQREQLKSVTGGYDGFYCAYAFHYCDGKFPSDYWLFDQCMAHYGC